MLVLVLGATLTNAPPDLTEFLKTLPHSSNYITEYKKAGSPKAHIKSLTITNKVEKNKP